VRFRAKIESKNVAFFVLRRFRARLAVPYCALLRDTGHQGDLGLGEVGNG
jgi:hypothetical protein